MSFNGRPETPVFLNIPLGPRFYPGPEATGLELLRGDKMLDIGCFVHFLVSRYRRPDSGPSWFLKSRLPASVYLYLYLERKKERRRREA